MAGWRSPVAKEGFPFIAAFAGVAALGSWFCPVVIGDIGLWILTAWCIWFFRDPERETPDGPGQVIAPADGRVIVIEEVAAAPLSGEPARKISIFMNVFNVHVNRSPVQGRVLETQYHPGKFLNAALDKASTENERMDILLEMADGGRLPFTQVAGLVARRIVCHLDQGQELVRGERFGLIRFGSRVDVYLPLSAKPGVTLGDTTRAGETVIAVLDGDHG
ncbi:MAG: phosphatidylserine decarboxylase family protein [Magnetococcales bacterium]|nr:phosphatidylserine decarboxylase family protein [Magnetococcales bacterium]